MDEFIYIQYSRAYRFDDVYPYNTCAILYRVLHFNFRGHSRQPPRVRPSILWLVKGLIGFSITLFLSMVFEEGKSRNKKGRRGIPR